jgi:hypothetical protein
MQASEKFNLDLGQPKQTFRITLTDDITKKVEKEIVIENVTGTSKQQKFSQMYKYWANGSNGNYSNADHIGNSSGETNLVLMRDNVGVTVDNAFCNLFKYDATNNLLPPVTTSESLSEPGSKITGYCYNNATTNTGDKGGIFVASLSGTQRYRAHKWVYEWGTTQANGTINAVGFLPPKALLSSLDRVLTRLSKVPEIDDLYYVYAGYKTVGADKHLYFKTHNTTTNNIKVIKAADLSHIATKSVDLGSTWSYPSHDVIFINDSIYVIRSVQVGAPGFTFAKGVEASSMTLGVNTVVTTSFPSGWSEMNFYSWTSDESFIYALVYNDGNTESAILKFDPTTDTIVSVTKTPSGFGAVGGVLDSVIFNICPLTGKLFSRATLAGHGSGILLEAPSITQLDQTMFGISSYSNGQYFDTSNDFTFIMEQDANTLVSTIYTTNVGNEVHQGTWWQFNRGNFFTYASLPSPIVKTNTQSLRVEYTLNI